MDSGGSVEIARDRLSGKLVPFAWLRSRPALVLAVSTILFAGVFTLRLVVEDPDEAVTVLFTLPIALLAVEFGATAGLAGAVLAMVLFGLWAASDNVHIGVLGVVARGVALFLLGGLVGRFSDRLNAVYEAACRQEKQLQTIIDATTAVIYLKDTDGRYLLINRQFEHLFHVKRHDVIGKNDYDLFPGYMADAFRANDRRALKAGSALEMEEVAPHDDGIHTYISLKFPLLDPVEGPYGICGISTDITGRKSAEQALKTGKDRVQEIINTAHEAFISMDAAGVITEWNHAAEETFGWPRSSVLGRSLAETIIPERHRQAHKQGIERFMQTGEGSILKKRIELPALHRRGQEISVELTISPARIEGGYVFHAFLHDISERKRLEEGITRLTPVGPARHGGPGKGM